MYARVETIEEECLDWESHLRAPLENMGGEMKKAVIFPVSQHKEMFLNEIVSLAKEFNIKRKLTHFLDENPVISFIFSMLTFPYMVGFLISYFLFSFYGGMSISSFLNIEQGNFQIELWAMGAYLFVTLWLIWIVLGFFIQRR